MSRQVVTVGIPVRDGARDLADSLSAIRAQQLDAEVELLVLDSGSVDDSRAIAASHGARILEMPPGPFRHGTARNILLEHASGLHVALLSQDAIPSGDRWLAALLSGFDAAERVGLVYGPYRPRADASTPVRRELEEFFAEIAPPGRTRIDRGEADLGASGFFTSANCCILRTAWSEIPFRPVPYAEDRMLARDMMAAGWAKVFEPRAAVDHSHEYPPFAQLRRSFDEWRGLREIYGHVEPAGPRHVAATLRRQVAADRRYARASEDRSRSMTAETVRSLRHHSVRLLGAALGSRADRLPPRARRALSLEGRAGFEPVTR